jgi:hypothetical protein
MTSRPKGRRYRKRTSRFLDRIHQKTIYAPPGERNLRFTTKREFTNWPVLKSALF